MWVPCLSLKFTVAPVYVSTLPVSDLVTLYLYTTLLLTHLSGIGQVFLSLQLHSDAPLSASCLFDKFCCKFWCEFCFKILLLCLEIKLLMFNMVLYESFRVFLLQILCKIWFFGKHSSIIFKNILPMFVFTFKEKGGLNHVIFPGMVVFFCKNIFIFRISCESVVNTFWDVLKC